MYKYMYIIVPSLSLYIYISICMCIYIYIYTYIYLFLVLFIYLPVFHLWEGRLMTAFVGLLMLYMNALKTLCYIYIYTSV